MREGLKRKARNEAMDFERWREDLERKARPFSGHAQTLFRQYNLIKNK